LVYCKDGLVFEQSGTCTRSAVPLLFNKLTN
jgi:hypothetical protein